MQFCDDMTAIFAHEVKNPISLIKANIELLEIDDGLYGYKDNFDLMKKEINKINTIISDFLLLYKPSYKNEIINIFGIIEQNINSIVTSTINENIKFYVNCFCKTDDIKIFAEKTKIDLVISNVYKNSMEAITGKNGVIFTNVYKKGSNTIIDIIDNGEGIKSDIKDRIYEPFATNKKEGSGLGIPICKKILEEIGGQFILFNNEKNGCTARLIF